MPSWHIAGDRSNASVVGAAAGPGAGDEVFLAAAEAAQAQRDSQGRLIHANYHSASLPPADNGHYYAKIIHWYAIMKSNYRRKIKVQNFEEYKCTSNEFVSFCNSNGALIIS